MKNNLRRFFYHFNKQNKKMTIHFLGKCLIAQNVIVNCPCETKWNVRQPRLVMRGFCKNVEIDQNGVATIS